MSDTYIPVALRRVVRERTNNCCEYCRIAQGSATINFPIDHVIAEKHGGKTESSNLCLSCYSCNSYKGSDVGSIDWSSGQQFVPLYNPRQQKWDDHFTLDGPRIQPRTNTGQVTSSLLRFNTPERIEERELLISIGEYPCEWDSARK
jgi:hypothetical protein